MFQTSRQKSARESANSADSTSGLVHVPPKTDLTQAHPARRDESTFRNDAMIMKRIDADDDNQSILPEGAELQVNDFAIVTTAPGSMYRCVPQDQRSLFLRIDTRRIGQQPTGPGFLTARRNQRDASLSELFLG